MAVVHRRVGVPEKILVVEDEQDLRELVGKYFGDMGYQVVVAADGADAPNSSLVPFQPKILGEAWEVTNFVIFLSE